MSKRRAVSVLLLSAVWLGANMIVARATPAAPSPALLSLKLNGVVDPFMASYVERGISAANRQGDAAVLLTIDTPGGLDSSMRHIIESILASRVPVICYTAPSGARAASAGTFIMLACPVNAMAPGTNIGAAHPVGVSGVIENEKVTNDAAAFIESLAHRWGRNAQWAERAVRDAISASSDEAQRLHVVDLIAGSTSQLLVDVGGCSASTPTNVSTGLLSRRGTLDICGNRVVEPFGMSIGERLFHSIANPNVAFLLLNIGFLALIAWIFHPGFHVALAVGVVCAAVGLGILETLPVRLTGLILIAVSAVLFVLDVKAKAHGVLTAGGVSTLILGGLLLFNPAVPSARVSRPLIVVMAVSAGLFAMFVLRALLSAKGHPVITGLEALEGSTGVATSAIAPTGRVRARGESWTAESVGGPIDEGATVRIVKVRGIRLLVEPDMETRPAETSAGARREEERS